MRGRCHVPSTATVKALCKQLVTVGEAITAHKRASRCHTVDGKCHSCKALQARVPREPAGSIGRRAWASARGRTAAGQQQSDRHQLRATQIPGTEMRAVRGGGGGGVPRPGVTAGRGSGHSSPLHSSLSWPGDGGGGCNCGSMAADPACGHRARRGRHAGGNHGTRDRYHAPTCAITRGGSANKLPPLGRASSSGARRCDVAAVDGCPKAPPRGGESRSGSRDRCLGEGKRKRRGGGGFLFP